MRALVTGSEGFIGSHFARELETRGWVVDRSDVRGEFPIDCREVFANSKGYHLLIHCAAVIGSRRDRDRFPLSVYENLSLDQAAVAFAHRTYTPLVYFSSSAVYPITGKGPFAESDFTEDYNLTDSGYGFCKAVGERLCAHLQRVHIVRPFSGYGEDQDDDYPFAAITQRASERQDPLDIWSDTARDFIHVDDIVNACLVMVRDGIRGPVNLGTGIPTTMRQLARIAARQMGYSPDIRVLGTSPGPDHRYADTTEMRQFYVPTVSLAEGVRRAIERHT